MFIVNLTALENGAHQANNADWISVVPDGWAMIPDGFVVPSTFPFVDIEAEELIYTREVEVQKTRYVPVLDNDGNPMLDEQGEPMTQPEPYTDKEPQEYKMMTVTAMTAGTLPEPSEEAEEAAAPDAQADTDALLIDHELRLTLLDLGLGGEVN